MRRALNANRRANHGLKKSAQTGTRLVGAFIAVSACVTVLLLSPATSAQEGVPGTGSIANEGRPSEPAGSCTAESSDDECLEYWEHHINWLSWDYRPGAGQAAEHRHMPPPFGFALINFAVFAAIMYRLAAKPLADYTANRHATIRKDLDEATALHHQADAKLKEYGAKIAGLDAEIDALVAAVRSDAAEDKARIIAEAEQQAIRLRQEAEVQIQVELRRMRSALKVEAVNAAIAAAEQILAASATAQDQQRLVERFVSELDKPLVAASSTGLGS